MFAEIIHEAIRVERRLAEVERNARDLDHAYEQVRTDHLRSTKGEFHRFYYEASEGRNACRIIMRHEGPPK
jgi:DNA-binding GntR family transcriptional regulator